MKTHTVADIRSWKPCYDPNRHLPEDWTGTALDMLQHPTIPDIDKIWLVRRYAVMTAYGLRRFAIDCARRAQTYPKNYTPDPRTLRAIEVAEAFNSGLATADELTTARKDAAAADAAHAAAYAAATDDYSAYVYAAYAAAADAAYAAAATHADNAGAAANRAAAHAAAYAAYADADTTGARNKERALAVAYLTAVARENLSRDLVGETEK